MEEILALDLLTLKAHTVAAGDRFTAKGHRAALCGALAKSHVVKIYRGERLAGYTYLWPKAAGVWFVGGFAVHPDFRFGRVILELLRRIESHARVQGITTLESHAHKTNRRSLGLHKRLGFVPMQENAKGIAFALTLGNSPQLFKKL